MSDALLLFGRALLAEAFIAAAAYAAYALCAAGLRTAPRTVRLAAIPVAGMWLATLGYHGLTALHAFHVPGACAALAILAVGVRALDRRSGEAARCLRSDLRWLRRVRARMARAPARGLTAIVALGFLPVALRPLASPIASWDGLTYHGIKAVLAVQTAQAPRLWAPGIWSYAGPSWGGHEALAAWAMLPLHVDLLACFVEVIQYAALGLCLFALAREARVREPAGSLAVAALLAVPALRLLVGSAYVEPAALAALAAGLLFVARALRTRQASMGVAAGAALGLAAGMKLTMLPAVAALGAFALLAILRLTTTRGSRLRAGALAGLALAVCVVPFALQGIALSGAPLTPVPLRVGGLVLGAELPEMIGYMTRPGLGVDPGDPVAELRALLRIFWVLPDVESIYGLGLPSALLLALGVRGALRTARRRPWLALAALGIVVVTCAGYFSPSFAVLRQLWSASSARFLLPAFVALVPFAGATGGARPGRGLCVALAALALQPLFALSGVGVSSVTLGGMLGVALGVVLLASALAAAARLPLGRSPRLVLGAGLAALALLPLAALRDRVRERVWIADFQIHAVDTRWLGAVKWIDRPERPRTIAVTSGPWQDLDNWFVLPFAGRRLQNRIVYVTPTRDGSIAHFGTPQVERAAAASFDGDAWLARLRQQGVTEVMSFAPRSLEQAWMEERPGLFRKLEGDAEFGLFELLP